MDRCGELVNIYAQSGLSEVLSKKETKFHETKNFTKLLFDANDWDLRSIEIWDTLKGPYFRIHHLERIADWMKTGINTIPGASLRSSNRSGSSLDGESLHIARQLRELLRPVGAGQSTWAVPFWGGTQTANIASRAPTQIRGQAESMLQSLKAINKSILEFAARPENHWLITQTRSYSTPFRGPLFGQIEQSAVAAELANQPVDALILGANPKDTGEKDPTVRTKYRDLKDQISAGLYSEAHWDKDGIAVPGWSAEEEHRWRIIYDALAAAGLTSKSIAFANFLPWGSSDLTQLVQMVDPAPRRRMVAFADELLGQIVRTLRPRLIIASLSISENLTDSLITAHRKTATLEEFDYAANGPGKFRMFYGTAQIGGRAAQLIHLRHPSSLRATSQAKALITERLTLMFCRLLSCGDGPSAAN
jgi:hypothetical protein